MRERVRTFRPAVLLFFLASGATGLVLEVVWARILGVVFGNTVYAASTVLTAFMLGLALGAAVLGRTADRSRRPLMLYGFLELGVGVYALLFPLLALANDAVYTWFYRSVEPGFGLFSAVRFALSLLLLLPPTFLMGGTLPVLGRHLGLRHREPGQEVGYLYGANTLGAVAGCFLAGFVLLQFLGVRGSLFTAGGTSIAVGCLAVALGRLAPQPAKPARKPPPRPQAAEAAEPVAGTTFYLVLIAFGLTGFCSLACEVLWMRVLVFVLGTSVYAFASMLTTFLLGIAAGSFLSARFLVPRLRRPLPWFGLIEVLVGLSILLSVPLLGYAERIDYRLLRGLPWSGTVNATLRHFGDALAVLFLPTLLMGAAFPVVTTACLRGKVPLGRRVGQVYTANTIGCVLGSFSAGFLLLPLLGAHRSLLVVVALNLAVGVALVWQTAALSAWARFHVASPLAGVAVAAFLLTPSDIFHDTINAFHNPSKIVFIKEDPGATVTVHDLPNGERLIVVDGVNVAGRDFMLRSTQKLQGYIPLCLHPNPRRVVQIGFGSGETARVGLEFGVEDYTVVEICPAVLEAGSYFEEINHGSYHDPRIRKIIMDGKNFARLSAEKFDIVMNDSTYPGSSGSSALYTVDHFRQCRKRLAEGGLFSCWVPLDLRPAELRMILRSFQEVFPHTSFWVASNCVNKHALILGSLTPLRIDFARLKAVVSRPDVAADLKAVAINDVYDLLDCHICDEAGIRELVRNDPVNSDDRPLLEFSCAIPVPAEGTLGYVLSMLVAHRAPVTQYLVNFTDEERDRAELALRYEATKHVFQAQVAQLMGDPSARARQLILAREANPSEAHVESCQAELDREIRDLRAALADRPGHPVLAMRLADKLLMAAHYEMALGGQIGPQYLEAGQLYERLAKVQPPLSPIVFVRLGEIRFRLGEVAGAESILRRCLRFWPESAEAHDRLAGICLKTGRFELAEHHNAEAIRLAPHDPRYQEHRRRQIRVINNATRKQSPAPKGARSP